jgi:hypothetical protein
MPTASAARARRPTGDAEAEDRDRRTSARHITGAAAIVPVVQAAHIRPVTADGENRVDNGLLLRSDVQTLFDRGYFGVHPHRKAPPGQPSPTS